MNNSSLFWLKTSISAVVLGLIIAAIALWLQTPQLFEYFNQAFCPH
ncbi:hypothetical protein ACNAUY_02190 [Acinetobacter tibetensis]|uniref:Signal pepetide n=2 Tax=Acinetobacter TaxID=469 RepID=R9AW87_9GAMM|nr:MULTISPECIES: hypothetical protein [Acinetobacter]EOR06482.1 hypothetical protein I593_02349 [Acinetobacter tandoii DSM 14970 = CIP 107469]UOG16636.1 hypothetical protein MP622_08825 [Acinetobacter sp. PK01]USE82344.1 hypothetical protein M5E07_11035 [Acinetobacter tibetensis]